MFLQLVLTYQIMNFNLGSINAENPMTKNDEASTKNGPKLVLSEGKPEL